MVMVRGSNRLTFRSFMSNNLWLLFMPSSSLAFSRSGCCDLQNFRSRRPGSFSGRGRRASFDCISLIPRGFPTPLFSLPDKESDRSSIPSREKKHKTRKKKKKKRGHKEQFKSVPVEEIIMGDHLVDEYSKYRTNGYAKRRARDTNLSNADHLDYIKMLDRHPALVLNADYRPLSFLPLSLWGWQDTVKAVFSGKVTVVDVYPDVLVRAVNIDVFLPSVIVLNEYVAKATKVRPAFTRRNVYLRDGYQCQYCEKTFQTSELTLDHVFPRCMGGALTWENVVTCCKTCNGRKGSKTVSQIKSIGMRLKRDPHMPSTFHLAKKADDLKPGVRSLHTTWRPFLGMDLVRPNEEATGADSGRGEGGARVSLDDQ